MPASKAAGAVHSAALKACSSSKSATVLFHWGPHGRITVTSASTSGSPDGARQLPSKYCAAEARFRPGGRKTPPVRLVRSIRSQMLLPFLA